VGNRGRDTAPELALRRAVHALGMRYRVGIRPVAGLRRTADLVFARPKVVVFSDGCFWHGCPDHFKAPKSNVDYWQPKIERNRLRDQQTDEVLAAAGWLVIRVWQHESPLEAAARVAETVRRRVPSP
jgi:DNA mismatch endonuclease, patch repair protein